MYAQVYCNEVYLWMQAWVRVPTSAECPARWARHALHAAPAVQLHAADRLLALTEVHQ